MTDQALAEAIGEVSALEAAARAVRDREPTAATVVRLVIPLRRMLEKWMTERAMRAVKEMR